MEYIRDVKILMVEAKAEAEVGSKSLVDLSFQLITEVVLRPEEAIRSVLKIDL